jgi:phosphatidylglycerophosphatase A
MGERSLADRAAFVLGTGFGSGLAPFAPGTFGTALAAAIVYGLTFTSLPAHWTLLGLALATTLACIPIGDRFETLVGGKDPQRFVLDEFAGFFIATATLTSAWPTPRELLVAFVLFRLFDVTKPPPARKLQDLRGGFGIVIDDVIAGVYALVGVLVYRDVMANPPW